MLLHYYTGHADEPLSVSFNWERPNNFRALRRRGTNDPWHFFVHDGESSLRAAQWMDNRANAANLASTNRALLQFSNPEWMHEDLLASAEYRIAFADEAQRLLLNDGAFTAAKAQAIWDVLAAQIDQDLSAIRIVNIVSYRFTDALYSKDAGMSVPIFHLYEKGKQHDISEELQFQSKGNSRFRWIAGLYYLNNLAGYPQEDIVIGNPVTVTPPVSPPHAYISTQSYAGFGQGTVNVLPKLDLVVGGRFSFDKDSTRWPNPGPGDEHTFTKFTYRVALDYHFADDTLGYVSANRGFKSGGFNPLLRDNEYLPEILTSYAAGIKSEFLEHRLRLNAEGYLYHYQDIQVLIPTFTGNLIANATAARMKGLEATLDAEPIRNLRVSAAFALENGEYLDYPGVQTITQQGAVLAPFNAKRKNTLQTPRATENLMASYRFQTSVGTFAAAVSAYHNAGYAFTTDNLLNQPAYTTLNAALTWAAPDEQFDIRFWGKNLTNAIVYQGRFAVSGFGWVQTQAAPTTYGVTFSAHLH